MKYFSGAVGEENLHASWSDYDNISKIQPGKGFVATY
jgi:hypothetical protein